MMLQALEVKAKENAVLASKLDQVTAENKLLFNKNNLLQNQLDALSKEHEALKATTGKKRANRTKVH